jgi:hypothetical protein
MIRLVLLLLAELRALVCERSDLVLEKLALRQQVATLVAKRGRPRITGVDRWLWTVLRRCWPRWTEVLVFVKPVKRSLISAAARHSSHGFRNDAGQRRPPLRFGNIQPCVPVTACSRCHALIRVRGSRRRLRSSVAMALYASGGPMMRATLVSLPIVSLVGGRASLFALLPHCEALPNLGESRQTHHASCDDEGERNPPTLFGNIHHAASAATGSSGAVCR